MTTGHDETPPNTEAPDPPAETASPSGHVPDATHDRVPPTGGHAPHPGRSAETAATPEEPPQPSLSASEPAAQSVAPETSGDPQPAVVGTDHIAPAPLVEPSVTEPLSDGDIEPDPAEHPAPAASPAPAPAPQPSPPDPDEPVAIAPESPPAAAPAPAEPDTSSPPSSSPPSKAGTPGAPADSATPQASPPSASTTPTDAATDAPMQATPRPAATDPTAVGSSPTSPPSDPSQPSGATTTLEPTPAPPAPAVGQPAPTTSATANPAAAPAPPSPPVVGQTAPAPPPSVAGAPAPPKEDPEFPGGTIVTGPALEVTKDEAILDLGGGRQGVVSRRHYDEQQPADLTAVIQPGDMVVGAVLIRDDPKGRLVLSRSWAVRKTAMDRLTKAKADNETIEATVVKTVKGGLVLDVGISGFLPRSLASLNRSENLGALVGQTVKVRVLELDTEKNRVVLDRKTIMRKERGAERAAVMAGLKKNEVREGVVKSIADFGVFVDIGGIEGLVHLSELSWSRVEDAKSVVKVGETVTVKILEVRKSKGRVRLSMRATTPDPITRAKKGSVVEGTVTRLADFGAFVDIGGTEGLVHINQLSEHRVFTPDEVVIPGDKVFVKVIGIDRKRRRVDLSITQAVQSVSSPPVDPNASAPAAPPIAEPEPIADPEPIAEPEPMAESVEAGPDKQSDSHVEAPVETGGDQADAAATPNAPTASPGNEPARGPDTTTAPESAAPSNETLVAPADPAATTSTGDATPAETSMNADGETALPADERPPDVAAEDLGQGVQPPDAMAKADAGPTPPADEPMPDAPPTAADPETNLGDDS